jgi:nucleoside phosphorylase
MSQSVFSPVSIPLDMQDRYKPKKDPSTDLSIVETLPSYLSHPHLLILTVTQLEFLSVFERMKPPPNQVKILGTFIGNGFYVVGSYGLYIAVLLQSNRPGQGNNSNYLNEALTQFKCKLVINVGIAWGSNNPSTQRLGDVLAATSVVNIDDVKRHHRQIIERSVIGSIHPKSEAIISTTKLFWKFLDMNDRPCEAHKGLYVVCNTLLDDLEVRNAILTRYPDAIGGEMEAFSVYETSTFHNVPWMVIKGINDWADGTKSIIIIIHLTSLQIG